MTRRWLGIDFSGDFRRWSANTGRSNVWIAALELRDRALHLASLTRVQGLPGMGEPFTRLGALLAAGGYEAAAIDAPFSLPAAFMPRGGHAGLLRLAGRLPHPGRPFPEARAFVRHVTGMEPPLSPPKPLRRTERRWSGRGVNTRSTLWAGSRGGAAMTAACLTLLAAAERPMWPWAPGATRGCLAEAFPAAQLWQWKLPHQRYDGLGSALNRRRIVESLSGRLRLGAFESDLIASADATDAVLAAFAARAVSTGALAEPPEPGFETEGWVAVHG